tara:strand:- start:1888 stop:2478 length:591 start_codon:yes stop_codon:yes gene_type:complete
MDPDKKTVVLDLDDTLIHSCVCEKMKKWNHERRERIEKKLVWHNMEDYYLVCERPGLQNFLDYLFKNFNVIVWTAASKDYALFIIKKCILTKPDRDLKYIFFDYHCDISQVVYKDHKEFKKPQKCLKLLEEHFKVNNINVDKGNVRLIDDLIDHKKTNGVNCIQIFAWKAAAPESHNDTVLKDDIIPQLETWKDSE